MKEKKFPSGFLTHPSGGQETILYLRVASRRRVWGQFRQWVGWGGGGAEGPEDRSVPWRIRNQSGDFKAAQYHGLT